MRSCNGSRRLRPSPLIKDRSSSSCPGSPGSSALAAGIRAPLVAAWSTGITIETEHVDVARFTGTGYERNLRELYRSKYAGRPFDLIVVAANEPLGLVLRSRAELWPGIPVIVCAIDERTLGAYHFPPGFTVAPIRYDADGTLRAALDLLPDTRYVVLVGGTSPQDRALHEIFRDAIRGHSQRLDVIDLVGLSLDDLLTRVRSLPAHTIVLASSFQVDGAGRRFYGTDIVGPISAASNRPLFSVFGTVMGLGIVGGSLVDLEAVGRTAGDLALPILRGESVPTARRPTAEPSALLFDWRQLRRFRLDERRLPAGSRVLHREPMLWEQYRWHVVGALALVAVQAGVIGGLLLERQRRRRAQGEVAERLRFEALVADLSATFARQSAPRVDEHIRDCLRRIVVFLGADRGTLWQPSREERVLLSTHSWAAAGVAPPPAKLPVFPLFRGTTPVLTLRSPEDLPAEAAAERRALEQLGVKSLLAIPLQIGERALGMLSFVSVRRSRSWPDDLLQELRPVAELFASALMRTHAATALQTSEALTTAVLAGLPGEAAVLDASGVVVQVNEAWAARSGAADAMTEVALGANYLDALRRAGAAPDDSARKGLRLIESVLTGVITDGVLEYTAPGERWYEMRVRRLHRPEGGAAIMCFDVTARRRATAEAQRHLAEIAHLDRVAALGQLASSLAHEINQPLTAILSNAQAARRFLAADPPDLGELRECLDDIVKDDRRAGEVIRRMRRLLRKDEVELQPVDLNELAQGVVGLVVNDALLHEVTIALALAPALPIVSGDAVQIQQVMLNLVVNAVTAAAAGPTAERRVAVWTAAVAGHAELGVRDSGKGIAESDLDRLFEPFFSTKPDGLGVGLAISRSIVEAHGGSIRAENDLDGGAIFRVRLPTERSPAA